MVALHSIKDNYKGSVTSANAELTTLTTTLRTADKMIEDTPADHVADAKTVEILTTDVTNAKSIATPTVALDNSHSLQYWTVHSETVVNKNHVSAMNTSHDALTKAMNNMNASVQAKSDADAQAAQAAQSSSGEWWVWFERLYGTTTCWDDVTIG